MNKNNARLATGKVSKRTIEKLCQYVDTVEKSEKIKEKKLVNPDRPRSEKSILKAGRIAKKDPISVTEKIIIFFKTKIRSSL